MNDKEVVKVCGICGDKAHGYNFNAITCESCKAFFRRNALRKKDFKCPFDSNCKIDSITRKFCKKCRLKKCFDIGMRKEWILSDEERMCLRTKIAENRKKRQTPYKVSKVADSTTSSYQFPNMVHLIQKNNDRPLSSGSHNTSIGAETNTNEIISSSTSDSRHYWDFNHSGSAPDGDVRPIRVNDNNEICHSVMKNSSEEKECIYCNEVQCLETKSQKGDIVSDSSDSPKVQMDNKCSVIIVGSSIESIKNNCIDSIGDFNANEKSLKYVNNCNKDEDIPEIVFEKVVELEFASIPLKELSDDSMGADFNRYESEKMRELSMATSDMNYRINTEELKMTSELSDIIDTTKVLALKCDQAIRKLVVMSKKMRAFKELCQHDQIALMKAGCFEMLIMRSVINFNTEHEYWAVLMNQDEATKIKLEVFKQAKQGNLYEAHKKFMQTLKKEWDCDHNVLNLLTAIILFTPDRPNIIHKDIIKYLFSKYKSKCEAKLKFLKYMTKLEELHIMHDQHIRIYLEVDPQDVGPLLIEILDLNPYNSIQT